MLNSIFRPFLLTAAFLLSWASLFGQSPAETDIVWSADRKLSWTDFEGTPSGQFVSDTLVAAITSSGFAYGLQISSATGAKFQIAAQFNPKDSWVRPNKRANLYLLAHEQLHFDLAELYARQFRKTLTQMNAKKPLDKKQVNDEYNAAYKAFQSRQRMYDLETEHSRSKLEQTRWQAMIAKEIEALAAYGKDQ